MTAAPPVVLVAGTWGDWEDQWWRPDSEFARMLREDGVTLLAPDDPFRWTTKLEGIVGQNTEWERAGDALRWYVGEKLGAGERVSVVGHSHGAQVIAYAGAGGLKIDRLITVAAPVRNDMRAVYAAARKNIWLWVHLYGNSADLMQRLGSWFDGSWHLRRRMKAADLNLRHPGVGHSELLDPGLWKQRRYPFFLAGSERAVQTRVELIRRGRARPG